MMIAYINIIIFNTMTDNILKLHFLFYESLLSYCNTYYSCNVRNYLSWLHTLLVTFSISPILAFLVYLSFFFLDYMFILDNIFQRGLWVTKFLNCLHVQNYLPFAFILEWQFSWEKFANPFPSEYFGYFSMIFWLLHLPIRSLLPDSLQLLCDIPSLLLFSF